MAKFITAVASFTKRQNMIQIAFVRKARFCSSTFAFFPVLTSRLSNLNYKTRNNNALDINECKQNDQGEKKTQRGQMTSRKRESIGKMK
jgi:hypothetical protein